MQVNNNKHRVVITGMGVVSPNGIGVGAFEQAIRKGTSGIKYLPELESFQFAARIGGVPEISDELKQHYFPKELFKSFSASILFGCIAGREAWLDAGLKMPEELSEPDWDTGAILGSGLAGADILGGTAVPMINNGNTKRLGSTMVEQCMNSGPSAYLGGLLALGNQVTTNSSACSTGTEAIVDAFERIKAGHAKRMLAGGSEGSSTYLWAGFDSMRVLNRVSNDNPESASRPMSASAAGFVPGAGAGLLMLESLESALQRKQRIYAEILGGAVNCGGQRQGGTMTAPNSKGVQRCIRSAVELSGIKPADIDAISGHLTSTMADPVEIKNWTEALGRKGKDFPYINSVKSMVGHCLGAAGAIESIATVLQLYKGFLHPSINCEDVHPEILKLISEERVVRKEMITDNLKIIAKASFGFGDVNSCLIFKKWDNT
ncbi:MAG: beta-ketoacyl-[acyl-carrier-protein] synthase family protein [Bacteroidia bacterium]|nr:beta-ketoacyl-[acyl-carrier-protein] synthase family protein [Bacteroidia bacterium]